MNSKTKNRRFPAPARTLVLATLLLAAFLPARSQLAPQGVERAVLARVDFHGRLERIPLPVYAELCAADGASYALVIAPLSPILATGEPFTILDAPAKPGAYVVAVRRAQAAPGLPGISTSSFRVLHDDGRQVVALASEQDIDVLAAAGLGIARLPDRPMVFREKAETATVAAAPSAAAVTARPEVQAMIDGMTQSELVSVVSGLSGEEPVTVEGASYTITTRYTKSGTPIAKATQYAYEYMQSLGLPVSFQNWTSGSTSGRNVIATKPGETRPDEIVVVCAHIDDMPSSGKAPGADDNASGCAGVMMAAKLMAGMTFPRTVRYAIFTGEEQGQQGSYAYASAAARAGDNIVAVLNLEMLGYDGDGDRVAEIHIRSSRSSGYAYDKSISDTFTSVIAAYGLASSLGTHLMADSLSPSDHSSFWYNGYPAIVVSEEYAGGDYTPYYHSSGDRLSTFFMDYYVAFTKAAVGTVVHLALGSEGEAGTPTARIVAAPVSGPAPLTVSFDGSASSGNGAAIVGYAWKFGDGTSASGAAASHTYNAAGAYTATLTVTDDAGGTGAATAEITATSPASVSLATLTVSPASVEGGQTAQGTVTLSGAAPAGGAVVALSANSWVVDGYPTVTVAAGTMSATFTIWTASVASSKTATISASYGGTTRTASLTVTPAASVSLNSLFVNPTSVVGGSTAQGTVALSGPAPAGGVSITLSDNSSAVTVPSSVTVAAGASTATFTVQTVRVSYARTATIRATYKGVTKSATLRVTRR
jgi:PKD repeat protein